MTNADKTGPGAPAVIGAQEIRVGLHAHRIAVPGTGAPATAAAASPSVEPIRVGDIIVGVDVTCSCGQRIRIAFDNGRG
jgi:hypothetical protein